MHLCPNCYSVCRCGGDYDDLDMTGEVVCAHYLLPECGADGEDLDEDEWDDDWSESDGE